MTWSDWFFQNLWSIAVTVILVYNWAIRKDADGKKDDETRDKRITALEDSVKKHVDVCTETPNSLLLSEIKHIGDALKEHAENDRLVADDIKADLREIRGMGARA